MFKMILICIFLSGCVNVRPPDSISIKPIIRSGTLQQDDYLGSFVDKVDGSLVKISWYYK